MPVGLRGLVGLKVVIVDDDESMRLMLRTLFEAKTNLEIVGEASSGADAIASVEKLSPDVVVMDVIMPGMNGIDATREIKARWPNVHVLALSGSDRPTDIDGMLEAGASGYLMKNEAADQLVFSLNSVWEGRSPRTIATTE